MNTNKDKRPNHKLKQRWRGGRYMFKQAFIYYPTDEKALAQIEKEIAAFRCAAAVRYIESLNLNDRQLETLYAGLAEDIATKQRASA